MTTVNRLPRAHLRPRSSGRANMLQWDAVHSEISQVTSLRRAFDEYRGLQLQKLLGEAIAPDDVLRRAEEAEAAGRADEARQLRVDLSRANQHAVVETLAVERSPRYQQEPPKTYCNIYAYDVVTALGGYLPRVWWMDAAIERLRNGEAVQPVYGQTVRELSANMLTDWMFAYGGEFGWSRAADMTSAQLAATHGWLVVILAARINRSQSGHVNIILAETEEHRAERDGDGNVIRPLQSQAGATNFQCRLHPNRWWEAPGYERGGAWLYGGAPDSPLIPPEQLPAGGGGMGLGAIRTEARSPSRPRPFARSAQEAAEAEAPFPGRREGSGYAYDGAGSAAFAVDRVTEAAERYTREGDGQRARACQVFMRLAQWQGSISAIDTSDERVLVWGPGFAEDGTLPWVWRYLDDSVKAYLGAHPRAGRYFGGDAMDISNEIRRDKGALGALVHVSEHDPHRAHVLHAQLQAFVTRIMGIAPDAALSAAAVTDDLRVLSLAADLAQWTPALFRMPPDLEAALRLAGGTPSQPPDPLTLAAAVILAHARHMLADSRCGTAGPRDRRVLESGSAGGVSPIARYQRDLRELFDTDRAPVMIPSRATALIPSLQRGTHPFFVGVVELDNLPRNRFVMVHEGLYYDFGPRTP